MVITINEREHSVLGFYCIFSSLFWLVIFTMKMQMEMKAVFRERQKLSSC